MWPRWPLRRVQSLDGDWSFSFAPNVPDVRTLSYAAAKGLQQKPEVVKVPSAFDVSLPGEPGRRGSGVYRKRVRTSPHSVLHLEILACSFYCRVWIDGVPVAEHRAGGYSPFWVMLPRSKEPERELLILADNRFHRSTAPLHTRGDFYQFGGLTRSVFLHEVRASSVSSLAIRHAEVTPCTSLDAVNVSVVFTVGRSSGTRHSMVHLRFSFDGLPPGTKPHALTTHPRSLVGEEGVVVASAGTLEVPRPRSWSPRRPWLHNLTVWLCANPIAEGDISSCEQFDDAVAVRFGLRTFGISTSGGLLLNGEELRLRGVNRHTSWPSSGSALSSSQLATDVALLNKLGVNYVRGAHYPQDQRFLDACDEAGA